MKTIQFMALAIGAATALGLGAQGSAALAQVTPQEADQLKSTLMPTGGERAGSADGLVPAWTGGFVLPLAKPDGRNNADPFANEKPLFIVTASNVNQYADKLNEGQIHLLKHYPGYKINVYPSHRTYAAPQRIYDGTLKCATEVGMATNDWVPKKGCGGILFPIPKTGSQVITNAKFNFKGVDRQLVNATTWYVSSDGSRTVATGNNVDETFPWFYPSDRPDPYGGKFYDLAYVLTTAPPFSAGGASLFLFPGDDIAINDVAWQYLTGQRRLRKYPSARYDTPFPYTSGLTNFDDTNGFQGPIDRYNWKLVGKKEFIVPYNNNKFWLQSDLDKLFGAKYPDPEAMRWEVHRVWVVDATLRDGQRHVVPHRTLYVDEDSWTVSASDQWDADGHLWKTALGLVEIFPEVPVVAQVTQQYFDIQKGAYVIFNTMNQGGVTFKSLSPSHFTNQALVSENAS